jgi:5-formyltetrahydrofolate cyclo-ligase
MIDPLVDERNRVRQRFLAIRDSMSPEERVAFSGHISRSLISLSVFREKQIFFVYCHYRGEVETIALLNQCLEQGKTVSVPLCQPEQSLMQAVGITDVQSDLVSGYKGILEPSFPRVHDRIVPSASIEVALIPGVVFDRCGNRLGYGAGFYDRFLAKEAPQAIRIGLAFSCQLADRIPALPHDVPMDMVVTEQEILTWDRGSREKNRRL